MYEESENSEFFHAFINCDKCGNSANVGGTMGKAFYMKLLCDAGWRLNSAGKKYIHLCRRCSVKYIQAQERRQARR